MNKLIVFLFAISLTVNVFAQKSTLTVSKGKETASHVEMTFSMKVNPATAFFSCNFQIAHNGLSEPLQVATTVPSADYQAFITNAGGLVLNCVVEDVPKAVSNGSVSWTIRFKKGVQQAINFALPTGGVNECMDTRETNYPAVLQNAQVEVTIIPDKITIQAYPNPTHDLVSIKEYKAFKSMTIYNLQGVSLVKTTKFQANVTDFAAGTYILEAEDTDGTLSKCTFVKQ
jgi:Secretion system C-terminal sorting domain